MNENIATNQRVRLLADVAEMYYLEGFNQSQIADRIGVTRSMVSRMLADARERGIVEFRIHRPLTFDSDLSERLKRRYKLKGVWVVVLDQAGQDDVLRQVGFGAARALAELLEPDSILGLAWGTFIRATVDAFELPAPMPNVRIVQLVGAGDSRIRDYDGHAIVGRMAQLIGGEGIYLNAPIMVENAEGAQSLLESKTIRETIALARKCDLALLGVGSTQPRYSTFFHSGYFSMDDLNKLHKDKAIGNVCGMHFTMEGHPTSLDFQQRLVTISQDELFAIGNRLGVAGGAGKVEPLLGALRGGYINLLVTDNHAAASLLELSAGTN
ncbi:MAG: sugar-binding transcriptional regulator [Anaerolineales bacterium]|jgi:DNA-binding transcriptional regulator LsrR (DeoR family)